MLPDRKYRVRVTVFEEAIDIASGSDEVQELYSASYEGFVQVPQALLFANDPHVKAVRYRVFEVAHRCVDRLFGKRELEFHLSEKEARRVWEAIKDSVSEEHWATYPREDD
jgi:hypothetical protein